MSKWDKLLEKICSLSKEMHQPKGGSSHCTFRKEGCRPVTIPKHEPIKKVYVEMVKEVIESEVDTDDAE